MKPKISPFLHPGTVSGAEGLAIIHLKRDLQVPAILREFDEHDEGYAEGKVVNTRFGSFPHKTLIGLPWGSQVRASKVDTGSRGRNGKGKDAKRKREYSAAGEAPNKTIKLEDVNEGEEDISTPTTTREEKEAVAATSGFIHLLPPTPENWTNSLPHRTQVVYSPDYSYILHRLRARPGTSIIEAGAGSGSFTHASARAVYNGYPEDEEIPPKKRQKLGKVWSFEFHEQRHAKLQIEIQDHGLESIVQITHRDVCEEGFLVDGESPQAEAVFLDLPAPWLALPHLTRSAAQAHARAPTSSTPASINGMSTPALPFISPLSSSQAVHLCSFSPCIEQVQRTISTMRHLGWTDIQMVELAHKRIEVRRERIGMDCGGRSSLVAPATVDEAVTRLIEVEGAFRQFHGKEQGTMADGDGMASERVQRIKVRDRSNPNTKAKILEGLVERKSFKEGRLVHRLEPEVKTHTSYLVFAVLPREWSLEDEEGARNQWPTRGLGEGDGKEGDEEAAGEPVVSLSRKQAKRLAREQQKDRGKWRETAKATDTHTDTGRGFVEAT